MVYELMGSNLPYVEISAFQVITGCLFIGLTTS